MKGDSLYLIHIKESIERIQEYTHEGKDVFSTDVKTQDAVLRNLHTLTESTQKLSPKLKEEHPDIDWRGISGFRNILVHDYLGVNVERVWVVVQKELPLLNDKVRSILQELGEI